MWHLTSHIVGNLNSNRFGASHNRFGVSNLSDRFGASCFLVPKHFFDVIIFNFKFDLTGIFLEHTSLPFLDANSLSMFPYSMFLACHVNTKLNFFSFTAVEFFLTRSYTFVKGRLFIIIKWKY